MDELKALRSLARAMGVHTRYIDGLGKHVTVQPETLLRVCTALGAPLERFADAVDALRGYQQTRSTQLLPPVLVAWDGALPAITPPEAGVVHAEVLCDDGAVVPLDSVGTELRASRALPAGYHRLTVEAEGRMATST